MVSANHPTIVRIVVDGSPSGDLKDNTNKARGMLMDAFNSDFWPASVATFAITPGGFIRVPFPSDEYDGECGWNSRPNDFLKVIPFAQEAINKVITKGVLKIARHRAKLLTLGVDLNAGGGKLELDELSKPHAEVVGVVNTTSGKVVHWTGKSYPVKGQEKTLIQEANLESHLFYYGNQRVLILGCHDLNMLGNRGYANQKDDGVKRKRCDKMRRLAKFFEPTIILQHPHSTDSPRVWSSAWGSIGKRLKNKYVYASGIAYHHYNDKRRRGNLADVLKMTRCCDSHVVDVICKKKRQ